MILTRTKKDDTSVSAKGIKKQPSRQKKKKKIKYKDIYKDKELELNEEIKPFLDIIAPSLIRFNNERYIIGSSYRCVWAVKDYPTVTTQLAVFRELGERDGVTLHIYVREVTKLDETKYLHKAELRNKFSFSNSKSTKDSTEAVENMNDIQTIIKRMHRSKEPLLHCAVFIEMIAYSKTALEDLQENVKLSLNSAKIVYDELKLRQKEGFMSVQPFGKNMFYSQFERVIPASSVANLYPFSYSGKSDPKGFYIGKDVNGSNILVNFDQRASDKTNGHILILGNSGQGKSYLCKIIETIVRQSQKKLYICDPENEYSTLTENLGGTVMNMMSGEYVINVLEPKQWSNNGDEDEDKSDIDAPVAFKKNSRLSQHIAFLRDFFGSYKPEISSNELDTLEIILVKLYKKFGIDDDTTNFETFETTDFPILSDLHELLVYEYENYDEKSLYPKDMLRSLALSLNSICVGSESIFFNGHSNIPNSDHIVFNVKEMLETNENLKNAMFFNIMSYMSHKFLTEGECVVMLDEFHEFLKNTVALSYVRSFVKRGRKRNSNVIIASQNPEDFTAPDIISYTKPIVSTPTHKFLFYPGDINREEYIKFMGIKDSEYKIFEIPNQGYCLYMCGLERYHLHVVAPPFITPLFGTAGGV